MKLPGGIIVLSVYVYMAYLSYMYTDCILLYFWLVNPPRACARRVTVVLFSSEFICSCNSLYILHVLFSIR